MNGLSALDAMLLQSIWISGLSAATLGILWNCRNLSVYLWCASGLLGSVYTVLAMGPIAESVYPTYWGKAALGLSIAASAWMKVVAIRLLTPDTNLRNHYWVAVLIALTLVVLPLIGVSHTNLSILLTLFITGLLMWLVRDVFDLGKRLQMGNAKVFAVVLGLQAAAISLMSIFISMSGTDPLAPPADRLPISSTIYTLILSLINTGLFISLILNLSIRQGEALRQQLVAAEAKQSRLKERQQLLADMHDGFGSQLITAKIQAERSELSQQQLVDVLRECLADLHLLVDGLDDRSDTFADTLKQYRQRTERRLAAHHVLLLWRIDLQEAPALSPKMTVTVLRIIQEAINNALKHAEARKIIVSAHCTLTRGITICIEDDGHGIKCDQTKTQGMQSMQRRARQLGATLNVGPRDDAPGTLVELTDLHGERGQFQPAP